MFMELTTLRRTAKKANQVIIMELKLKLVTCVAGQNVASLLTDVIIFYHPTFNRRLTQNASLSPWKLM